MRLRSRRFLSFALLATYAGISFLGEGLHWLLPEAGHQHHHGLYIVHCDRDCPGHADHDGDHHGTPASAALSANEDADSHVCEICEFLFQAVSQPAEVASPIDWQPLIVAVASLSQPIYTPAPLGPQAPRGPPLLA